MEISTVQVAVRCRPLSNREKVESPSICLSTDSVSRSVSIGTRTFTFDQVFSLQSTQREIYETCVEPLLESCLTGYNAAILAYGQTGSGKTFTMGSAMVQDVQEEVKGIIPRVIERLISEVQLRKETTSPVLRVSFLEIYNEEIHDLLTPTNDKPISIREESGVITLPGLSEELVNSAEEMAGCLTRGSLNRVTAATLMNEQSSRSHAIFTISIEQMETEGVICSKFTFVDLAGSERIKRTGAVGAVLKEGININLGLLTLGKVISSLTEEGKKGHVPYRESKLTRILQDSLGGNSKTWMIACVSPAEDNFDETLNTLRYASNARKIKNKPVVNRDPKAQLILELRAEVEELRMELCKLKGEEYVPQVKQTVGMGTGRRDGVGSTAAHLSVPPAIDTKQSPLLSLPSPPFSSLSTEPTDTPLSRPRFLSVDSPSPITDDQDTLKLKEIAANIAAALHFTLPTDSQEVQEEVAAVLENSVSERETLLNTIYESLADMQKQILDTQKTTVAATANPGESQDNLSKEHQKLLSLIDKQKEKIEKLAKENSQEKDQRLNLAKKLKTETAAMTKWKSQTSKEFLKLKRTEILKTQQIHKLSEKLKKTDALAKRKIEELSSLQRKHRQMAEKLKKKGGLESPDEIREWVQTFANACYQYGEITEAQTALKSEENSISASILTLQESKMRLKLEIDQFRMMLNSPDIHHEIELSEKLREINEEEEALLEKLAYIQDKLGDYEGLLSACDFEEVRNRTQTMLTLADAGILVEALLEEVINQIGKLKRTENNLNLAIEEGKENVERVVVERNAMNERWKREYERLKEELRVREQELLQSLCEQSSLSTCSTCSDRESRITDLQQELESTTNLYNQSIARSNLMKKQLEELQQELGLADKQTRPKSATFAVVIDKALRRMSASVASRDVLSFRPEWTLQAHAHDIKNVLQVDSTLVTASYRSCKVWSLEDRQLLQELPGHTDYVKALQWWSEYNSLITTSKSNIILWDLSTGHSVKTLKASPKIDLRTVQTWDNYLAAAGQGVESCPRLEIWDLRRADL